MVTFIDQCADQRIGRIILLHEKVVVRNKQQRSGHIMNSFAAHSTFQLRNTKLSVGLESNGFHNHKQTRWDKRDKKVVQTNPKLQTGKDINFFQTISLRQNMLSIFLDFFPSLVCFFEQFPTSTSCQTNRHPLSFFEAKREEIEINFSLTDQRSKIIPHSPALLWGDFSRSSITIPKRFPDRRQSSSLRVGFLDFSGQLFCILEGITSNFQIFVCTGSHRNRKVKLGSTKIHPKVLTRIG
mmetsp:Transcript_32017/g.43857  ORF Transcript_32017/g.43857 Transcript_32017/m.43857 type:complete len:240 (+) Transcript_32017:996-1715(+)